MYRPHDPDVTTPLKPLDIHQLRRDMQLSTRPGDRDELIMAMHVAGVRAEDIADEIGMSTTFVRHTVARYEGAPVI